MSDLHDVLRAGAITTTTAPDFGALLGRVRRRRRRRSVTLAATVSLLSIAGAIALKVTFGEDSSITMIPPATTETPDTSASTTSALLPTPPITTTSVEIPAETTAPVAFTTPTSSLPPSSPPVVTGPNGIRRVNVRVVGPNGTPFPKSTVTAQACPVTGDPCIYARVVDDAGTVYLELVPDTQYKISAMVRNTGWANPWISPTGVGFHFSDSIETSGAELEDGTVFVIEEPSA